MGTWTSFYVRTSNADRIANRIAELTDNLTIVTQTTFPKNIEEHRMLDMNGHRAPNYLAIGQSQPDWVTVYHNSFSKLEDWGEVLSKEFETQMILISMQSVSDYYYFAMYDNGEKIREIETCYSEDFEETDFGKKFDFEGERAGKKYEGDEEEYWLFDFDAVEEYCDNFNIELMADTNQVTWTVLKGQYISNEVKEYIQQHLTKKPWWKFW